MTLRERLCAMGFPAHPLLADVSKSTIHMKGFNDTFLGNAIHKSNCMLGFIALVTSADIVKP
jgi:hypothetical protein